MLPSRYPRQQIENKCCNNETNVCLNLFGKFFSSTFESGFSGANAQMRYSGGGSNGQDLINSSSFDRYGRFTGDFTPILDTTFSVKSNKKQRMFKEGEKHYCGELFRFYAAILEWERVYKQDP